MVPINCQLSNTRLSTKDWLWRAANSANQITRIQLDGARTSAAWWEYTSADVEKPRISERSTAMASLLSVLLMALAVLSGNVYAKCACSASPHSQPGLPVSSVAMSKQLPMSGTAENRITPLPAPTQVVPALTDDDLPDPEAEEQELRARLGRATWYLLHTMAAKYPESPTAQDKQRMLDFFRLFGEIYPCPVCSEHFRGHLTQSPPKVDSRKEFSQWMCDTHNTVNRMLGKPEFPCANVNSFYDCGCEVMQPVPNVSQIRPAQSQSGTKDAQALHAIMP